MYYPMMWGGGNFSFLWSILIIVGIIMLIGWMRKSGHYGQHGKYWGHSCDMEKPSIKILEERYAKGEIDRKEFEERRKVLLKADEHREKNEDTAEKETNEKKKKEEES